jgi:alkylated DNA repair dioxygenase AlkB
MISLGQNILPKDGEVYYIPKLFSKEKSVEYLSQLMNEIQWKQEPVKIFGREIMQPRLTAWYGDSDKPYTYSGLTMEANEWTPVLKEIKSVADEYSGSVSSSALLNLYRDGNDGLGWHRDNEKVLGPAPVIASLSFGEERLFQLRNYANKKQVITLVLEHGSLVIMKGSTQRNWQHRIPKTKKLKGPRVNVTFREVL